MKNIFKVFILSLLMISFITGCGEKKENSIKITSKSSLKSMIKKSKSIDNIYYEVLAEYQKPDYAKSIGKTWIKNRKVKQDLNLSGRNLIVFMDENSKDYVSYSPDDKTGTKMELTDKLITQNSPFGLIEGLSDDELKGFKKLANEKVNKKDCYVFQGSIENNEKFASQNLKDIKYKVYYQIENNLIVKMEISSEDKVITKIAIEKMNLGKVKDSEVKKEIPKDINLKEVG